MMSWHCLCQGRTMREMMKASKEAVIPPPLANDGDPVCKVVLLLDERGLWCYGRQTLHHYTAGKLLAWCSAVETSVL